MAKNSNNVAALLKEETTTRTRSAKTANNNNNSDTLEEVNARTESIVSLARKVMLNFAIATTASGKTQFDTLCDLLASNDKYKEESEYFRNVDLTAVTDMMGVCNTRWTQASDTDSDGNTRDKFMERVVKEDTTDSAHVYRLITSPVADLATLAGNIHSHYAYTKWKEGAQRRVAMREVKALDNTDLKALLALAKANGLIK